jgi:GNAT superfamily N-acetyltransferase
MASNYLLYRGFSGTAPFLEAVRTHADEEREALGFLPEPAYAEAARQGKLIVLAVEVDGTVSYSGHLLFGGIFPHLRVRQICVSPKWRGRGFATTLLRTLKSQAEADGYLILSSDRNLARFRCFAPVSQFSKKALDSRLRGDDRRRGRGRRDWERR